ncbi:metallophosphoesterase [Candidatus Micrarchaeota archaeon]|nr:metallophosphoesterase [Candidatus Micrarchaeota archaeon]
MAFKVFVVGDTHFLHDNIIKHCGRPFAAEEMTGELVKRWNAVVGENDLVIHLGDFAFFKGPNAAARVTGIIRSLNGRKVLVRGNHDYKAVGWYLENGFDFVCNSFSFGNVLFSHRPAEPEIVKHFGLNFHGHVHDKDAGAPEFKERYVCVSVEKTGYAPVLLDDVLKNRSQLSHYNKAQK